MASFARTEEQGAVTPLHVALAPDWETATGAYVKDRKAASPNPLALDPALVRDVDAATQALVLATMG